MEQKKVGFGIIGLGLISNRFASVLNTCDQARLAAVAARSQERADAFAKEHQAEKAYGSYQELMEDPAVDIVYIGLTHNFHYEVAKQCILHGKAVLCEKPFFLTKAEAEEVISLARENKVLLMEAMWTRCLPVTLKTKEWIRQGKIGSVKYMDAQFSFHVKYDLKNRLYNPDLAGGALYDAGVYPLEYATGIMERLPVAMQSMHTSTPNGLDSFDVITMQFADGAIASLVCGISLNTNLDAGIYGPDGHIIVRDFIRGKQCELYDDENNLIETFTETAEDGFIYQIEHIIDLYRSGKLESPYIPHKDTIDCAGLFDQLHADWSK